MSNKKSEITKKQIMDSYLQLMEKKNWKKITVKEIYSNVDLTRSTFYQYFSNIYDLMERIETPLLESLEHSYAKCNCTPITVVTPSHFEDKFDVTPLEPLYNWFHFCMKHKKKIQLLLGENADPYFTVKLKQILKNQISKMMDFDGLPNDLLREPFIKAFIELHILSVNTLLSSENDKSLTIDEIINLLNTMRVGGNYLSYRSHKDFSN